ncbi:phenylacetate--CoA ligase family protein [Aliikangiella sp. G2MR2-5]|uniref:phenylacetate--CoA ligase family protein n=1 Tax=Aliikangiella sp. G2MR2-5 TaxID=2788943 RepID=UPI0018AB1774|nr:phenylacetate--CoA ligase family protein [Aliikangiella sp. G2MR2-5]
MNFYQDVFFRSLDRLRGRKTIERLHFLRKSQNWSREQIDQWQLEKLNELLTQAKSHSPFHSDRLRNIELPLKSLKQLENLPILTKSDIRKNQASIKSDNIEPSRFVESRTGGSTGEPMFYFWDKRGMDWNRGTVYRSAEWADTKLGEKTVQMSGSHFDYTQSQSLQNKIVYFLQRYKDYPVSYLTDEILESYYQDLLKFKPTSIWGYASGVNVFAEYIEKNHPDTNFDFLKAIMTSSEMLWPKQRETINRVFGGEKVFDQYGSREFYMGAECKAHNGYHLHSEVILLEVVDDDGKQCKPGELGRILITDLSNHAFPFIRYEIGDLGILEEPTQCKCGMHLPRLKSVQGRIADMIVLEDRVLTPPNFTILMSDIRGLKSFQLQQHKIDEIEVHLVKDTTFTDEVADYIHSSIKKMVNDKTEVSLKYVDDIAVPESGKRRFIISTVNQH